MSEVVWRYLVPGILLVLALAVSWWFGRKSVMPGRASQGDFSRDYFVGLNYLVNDEPDDAIDIFIRSLEIDSSSLEAHLALGALLRRRGKVDKSISVYQSLLARPRLDERQVNEIKVELTRSYIASGLLDRAERLLEQLQQTHGEFRQTGLSLAMNVFQIERDWENGVKAAEELIRMCPARDRAQYQLIASHFYCEIAEEQIESKEYKAARQSLKKAYQMSRSNARVSFLTGQVEMQLGDYKDAIKALARIQHQDPDYFPDAYGLLLECYQQLNSGKQLERFVESSLEEEPSAGILLNISEHITERDGSREALRFLMQHIKQKPSLVLMSRALRLLGEESDEEQRELHLLFHHVIEDFLQQNAMYRCGNCGFEGKYLHWQCPGCASWGTVRPVKGIAGE